MLSFITIGKKGKIRLAVIICVLIVIGLVGWQYVVHSPQYSLVQTAHYVKSHDYDGFKQYVDVDQIVSDAVDQLIEQAQAETIKANAGNEWAQLGANFGSALITAYKPQLKTQFINRIRQEVEDGNFGKKDVSASKITLLDFWTKTKVQRDGKVALVTIPSYEIKPGTPISFKMRQLANGSWQISALDFNLADLGSTDEVKQDTTK